MQTNSGFTLHHVGYAVQLIEPATQAYVQRFGYEIATSVIHDPLQTALVQFLKLPGDRAYLEFVAPDSPQSKLSAVTRQRGGLHHLCYACGPLEAAVASLEEAKMRLISDPTPAIAFGNRRICWLFGPDQLPIELVERISEEDLCLPGTNQIPP